MKVVLTHGYFIEEDAKEQEIMRPYPPLGLLYVTAFLKEHNYNCLVFDSTFESATSWKEFMLKEQPDVVFFYTNLMTKINVIQLNRWLKAKTTATTVIGGPDVTYNLENYLSRAFDFAVIGEGEQTSLELLQAIENKGEIQSVAGIAFLQKNEVIQTPPRVKMRDLSELPLPAREAIDFDRYLSVWKKFHGKATANISTQRGCPYSCKWCSTAVYGRSYRRRPAHLVADEIEYLKNEKGVEALWFVDDVFTVKFKWVEELYAEFKRRNLTIDFEIISRAERLNEHILQLLKEMGCFRIWIGAESGSQEVIDKMRRSVSVNEVREKIRLTQQMGIEAGTFIMVGYPGEKHEDILETAHHLKVAPPNQFTVTEAYPIKGTELYQEVEPMITEKPNWETSTDREIKFERPYSQRYYTMAVRYIYNTWKASFSLKEQNRKEHLVFKMKAIAALIYMKALKYAPKTRDSRAV